MAFLPYAITAAGALQQASAQHDASVYNAQSDLNEQKVSVDQANAQTGQVIRSSRESLGRQAAAFGAAGVGYGGSSEGALDQSAINQEMDALNSRYKGTITGYGYGAEAGLNRQKGNSEMAGGVLTAGAALLKGSSSSYSFTPPSPAVQAGIGP